MKEIRVFSMPLDPHKGFDDTPIQLWLAEGRALVKQTTHLIEGASGVWLTLVVESERLVGADPWATPAPHPKAERQAQQDRAQESARTRQRREERQKRQRDLEAALKRLDERAARLFECLRTWRSARTSAEGLPPYEFGSDLLLCEVARVRPQTAQALRDLPQCKPRFFKLAGEELLEVIKGFERGEEQAWLTTHPPQGQDS